MSDTATVSIGATTGRPVASRMEEDPRHPQEPPPARERDAGGISFARVGVVVAIVWVAAMAAFTYGFHRARVAEGAPGLLDSPALLIALLVGATILPVIVILAASLMVSRAQRMERTLEAFAARDFARGGPAAGLGASDLAAVTSSIASLSREIDALKGMVANAPTRVAGGGGGVSAADLDAAVNRALDAQAERLALIGKAIGADADATATSVASKIQEVHDLFGDGAEQLLAASNILDERAAALTKTAERATASAREAAAAMASLEANLARPDAGGAARSDPGRRADHAGGLAGGGESDLVSLTQGRLEQLEQIKRQLGARLRKPAAGTPAGDAEPARGRPPGGSPGGSNDEPA